MKGATKMIVNAIELKKKVRIGDSLRNESSYEGNPGDYLVTTVSGNQTILSKEIFKELQSLGVAPREALAQSSNFPGFIDLNKDNK